LTLKARKRFGQNFLHNPRVIRKIVSAIFPSAGEQLVDIGSGAIKPPPKVESAIIQLQPHSKPIVQIDNHDLFARELTQAFAVRLKTLHNSLRKLIDAKDIQALGIAPVIHAERLTLVESAALANAIALEAK